MLDCLRPHPRRLLLPILAAAAVVFSAPLAASAQTGVQFDGSNDYVTFGQATSTLGVTTFTIEVWFKRTGLGNPSSTGSLGISAIPLLTKGQNDGGEGTTRDINYFLGIRPTDSVLVADFEEGAAQAQPGLNHPVMGTTAIRSNTWYHAAAVYNGTDWFLYLNGNLEKTMPVGAGRLPNAASIEHAALGASLPSSGAPSGNDANDGFFNGVLDEARIWDHARPAAGIRDSALLEITSAPGLLGRWGLNDGSGTTAVNSIAGSPDGTLTNGPTWVAGTPFAYSYSAKFNGSSAYVGFGNPAAAGLSTFTLETWFRRDAAGTSASTGAGGVTAIPLIAKGVNEGEASTTDANYFLGIDASTGTLVADFEEGAAGASPGLNHPIAGTTAVATGVWNHAAATYDGDKWQLFLNGQLESELVVGRPAQSASVQHLGVASALNSAGTAAGFFNGALDETRIWNSARSRSDIQSTINTQIVVPTSGLVARWGMNEGAGRVVRDTSGSAIHGTLNPASITQAWGWMASAPFNRVFYDLNVTVVGSGSVGKSPDQPNYNSGSLVQLSATPGVGYSFTGWSGDAGGAANPLSVTMDATKNITATFTLITYTIDASAGPNGSISPSGAVVVNPGANQSFDITPATNYHIADVVVDGGSVGPVSSYEFTNVTAPHTISATFAIDVYTIDASAGPNGSISPSGAVAVNHGANQSFDMLPATGYHVADVVVDGGSVGAVSSYEFTNVTAAHTISASFAINTYALMVTVVGSGSVAKVPDQTLYDHGTLVELTATPDPGYGFAAWSGDASGAVNPLQVTMDQAKSITATFVPTHMLTVAVDPVASGTVSRVPDLTAYNQDSSVELTAVPATGYHFVDWSGDLSGSVNPQSLVMDADKSVTAHFAINTYTLDVTITGNGTVSKDPDQSLYDHGTLVDLTPTPDLGYAFLGWGGDASGNAIPLQVTMDQAKTITAAFTSEPVGVGDAPVTAFALSPIVPNPVGARARVGFALPCDAEVRLSLVDVLGREVARLAEGRYPAGRHAVEWTRGRVSLPSGMYFVRLRTPAGSFTQRVVLAR